MMYTPNLEERVLVTAVGVLAGAVYLGKRGCGAVSAAARLLVGVGSLTLAVAVGFAVLEPVIGYALMCLLMVAAFAIDLIQEEHARRRRVASLAPRPRVEFVPALWTLVAVLSATLVLPFIVAGRDVLAALIVGVCTLSMAGIAWRIASAPMQLTGNDPARERIEERASRAQRSGISCVLAVGIEFVFACFTLKESTAGLSRWTVIALPFALWVLIWTATALYVRSIRRSLHPKAA